MRVHPTTDGGRRAELSGSAPMIGDGRPASSPRSGGRPTTSRRTAVYRRWPYKDLFCSDLLNELAQAATPAAMSSEETSLLEIRQGLHLHHPFMVWARFAQ